jgi:diguanylate cyclase (GGDEF)-like protein
MRAASQPEPTIAILDLCLELDRRAVLIYERFARQSPTKELSAFWREMAAEEVTHCKMWESLRERARSGGLPRTLDGAEQVVGDLQQSLAQIDSFLPGTSRARDDAERFLMAYRLELQVMHPVFETLFGYLPDVLGEPSASELYDGHLNRFLEMQRKAGLVAPELELLGETVHRLWRHNRQLARQSQHDDLTGVLNRRGFFSAASPLCHLAQRGGYRVGMLMIDIDNFKRFNDEYGHLRGDSVLREVASVLRGSVRSADLVGRYGGEEFVILLAAVKPRALEQLARRICRSVARHADSELAVTVSIGMTDGPIGGDIEASLESLLARADACLYRAKAAGKNRAVYEPM